MTNDGMELGAFSVSLSVKDLAASRAFYEKLGFSTTGGDGTGYLIMANGTTLIGLFQGMFEGNILTFNPGLGQNKELLTEFTDIRDLRQSLVDSGVEMTSDLDPGSTGPASVAFVDPDGNAILIDQFFERPGGGAD